MKWTAVLFVLGVAACRGKGDGGPPCDAVGAKFFVLAKDDLGHGAVDEKLARAVTDQLPAMRDSLVTVCKETTFSTAVRTCLTQAPDHTAFAACESQLTEDQRRALDRATRGEDPSK